MTQERESLANALAETRAENQVKGDERGGGGGGFFASSKETQLETMGLILLCQTTRRAPQIKRRNLE